MPAPLLRIFLVSLALLAALPVLTRAAQASELARAYLLEELFVIMAEEGRHAALAEGAVPLQGGRLARFESDVNAIYDSERLLSAFLAELEAELEPRPAWREEALAFADTDLGQRVLRLEITAREALLDDAVDETARIALDDARAAPASSPRAARLALVRARIYANDLTELNVSLGLNTSLAYYRGMQDEDAVFGLSDDDLLRLVWEQERAIRADTEDWIESYFLMAYQPLSDDEMRALVEYAATPAAVGFNQAMFRAFDTVFSDISRRLGQALGLRIRMEEL